MLRMFFLHSAAYWLCMPVRAFIMISSFSGVKRYFVKRGKISSYVWTRKHEDVGSDSEVWNRCWDLLVQFVHQNRHAMWFSGEGIGPVNRRGRARLCDSPFCDATQWSRRTKSITEEAKTPGSFPRSNISRTETVSSTVTLFIIWHVTQSKQIIPSPRAKYKSRAGGCWCTCRAQ